MPEFPPFPSSPALAGGLFIFGLFAGIGVGLAAGWLKLRHGIATNYTRKIFHFTVFTTAMAIHVAAGWAAVNAYAAGMVMAILLAVTVGGRGRSSAPPPGANQIPDSGFARITSVFVVIYEALARERDAPHRSYYILVPLAATAAGGLAANWLAGDFAMVGYLVAGWGDAAGEPVGRWLGRHEYRVRSLRRVPSVRTLEGSAAVGIAAFIAAWIALQGGMGMEWAHACRAAGVIAFVTIFVEAFSPHGGDNFTTMVAAALLARALG